jgi:hypothetical protein
LDALNIAARQWMDTIANVRIHRETRKQPLELFASEKQYLKPLLAFPADTGVIRTVRATNRFRIVLDTNRYSVPSLYASQRLLLKTFTDRLCIYHAEKLIATHTRSYDRHRDFENPDHVKELLERRRAARDAKLLLSFYALCSRAEDYHRQLLERRLNPRVHIAKIMALSEIYGHDKMARAIEDAFSSKPSAAITLLTSSNSASASLLNPVRCISPGVRTCSRSNWLRLTSPFIKSPHYPRP